jgi:glycerate 2-kinase
MRALACPASLKGVLSPLEAATHLAWGIRRVEGWTALELPVADGGEHTIDVLHGALGGAWRRAAVADPLGRRVDARWLRLPSGTAVVEAAQAIGLTRLAPAERNPLVASSAGFGELLAAAAATRPPALLVCVGGTATVDGGAGLLAVAGDALRGIPVTVACDVRNPLLGERGAARVYGPQKGADEAAVEELEARLAAMPELEPYRDLPGAGAGGGLGAALASLGGTLLSGIELVLQLLRFDEHAQTASLVVTGEGTVDATTFEGKAPGAVAQRCAELGVPCVIFGGRVVEGDAVALSGDPSLAAEDLAQLGEELALSLV